MQKGFSTSACVKTAWEAYRYNWGFLLFAMLLFVVVPQVPTLLIFFLFKPGTYILTILNLVQVLLTVYLTLGCYKVAWRLADNQSRRSLDLFSCFPQVLSYIITQIVVTALLITWAVINYIPYFIELVAGNGMHALAVDVIWDHFSTGIVQFNPLYTIFEWDNSSMYTMIRSAFVVFHSTLFSTIAAWIMLSFWLIPFVLIENSIGPLDGLKKCYHITQGARWDLFSVIVTVATICLIISVSTFGLGLLVVAVPFYFLMQGAAYRSITKQMVSIDEAPYR